MPHPLNHKYPIPISQLGLAITDVPAGVGASPLDTKLPTPLPPSLNDPQLHSSTLKHTKGIRMQILTIPTKFEAFECKF